MQKKYVCGSRLMVGIILLTLLGLLTGCGGFIGDGRMDAWKNVRQAEETTNQKFLEAKKVELEKKPAAAKQNPTLKLTAYDQTGKVVSTAEMDLQPVIAEITGGKKTADTYGVNLTKTDIPKGEFAENAEAGGNAIAKVASSPGTIALGITYNERKRAQDTGDTNIKADTVNLENSLNRTEAHNLGTGTQNFQGTTPQQVVEPKVVEPTVLEPTIVEVTK